MKRLFSSLRARSLLLVILAFIPTVFIVVYSAMEEYEDDISARQEESLRLVRHIAYDQQQLIEGTKQLLTALTHVPLVTESNAEACSEFFSELLVHYRIYANIAAFDIDGRVYCSGLPLKEEQERKDYSSEAWFQRAVEKREFALGDYKVGSLSGKRIITAATPIIGPDGRISSIVASSLDLDWLGGLVAREEIERGGTLKVIDRNGTVLIHYPESERWIGSSISGTVLFREMQQRREGAVKASGMDGVERLYAFTPLKGAADIDAYVCVGISYEQLLSRVDRDLADDLTAAASSFVLVMLIAWFGSDLLVSRRMKALAKATGRLAEGDFSSRTGLAHDEGEVGELAKTFDGMAASLEAKEAERRVALEALQDQRDFLDKIINSVPGPIFVKDRNYRFVMVNKALCTLTGRSLEEIIGKYDSDFFPQDQVKVFLEKDEKVFSTGIDDVNEEELEDSDGNIRSIMTAKSVYTDSSGKSFIVGVITDISERKRYELALKESEERFRLLYEDAPVGYHSLDENGRLLQVNRAWLEILGYNREEVLGRHLVDFLSPGQAESFSQNFSQMKSEGEIRAIRYKVVRKDGSIGVVEMDGKIARNADGGFMRTHTTVRDVTVIKQTEETIKAVFQSIVGSTGHNFFERTVSELSEWLACDSVMIGELTAGGERVQCISARVDGTITRGCSYDLLGTPCADAIRKGYSIYPEGVSDSFPRAEKLKQLGAVGYIGIPLCGTDGRPLGILCAISRNRLNPPTKAREALDIIAARAVAEIERMQAEEHSRKVEIQLRQARKMEAIGTMAGGFAHEFNNILAAAMGHMEMALYDAPQRTPLRESIEEALKAANRAKGRLRQILTLSRMNLEEEKQVVKVGSILRESLDLLQASLPPEIELRCAIEMDSIFMNANAAEFRQVLTDLSNNAIDAMREKGGTLDVRLTTVDFGVDEAAAYEGLKPGPYLKLSVTDTGQGMESDVLERIFDPYFTTRSLGKASGLGLALVNSIVRQHGGNVSVRSKPGIGATFEIILPRVEGRPAAEQEAAPELPKGKGERILLVDDEEALSAIMEKILGYLGYRTVAKLNGVEALDAFKAEPDSFDLVICDYKMPFMTGEDLSMEILSIRRNIPIILCTGYSDNFTAEKAMAMGIRGYIMKPVAMRNLAQTVRDTLDAA
jgi:PAS domain S-box-containing protein